MELRCREGELALIIKEEPGCECNIGRTVTVAGPIFFRLGRGPTWLIEPTTDEPWTVRNFMGCDNWTGHINLDTRIEHPDSWLLPIRPENESDQLTQEVEKPLLVEEGV